MIEDNYPGKKNIIEEVFCAAEKCINEPTLENAERTWKAASKTHSLSIDASGDAFIHHHKNNKRKERDCIYVMGIAYDAAAVGFAINNIIINDYFKLKRNITKRKVENFPL